MRRTWLGVATVLAGLAHAARTHAETPPRRPVVVELFTSEGCSSCPAAEAVLDELARTRADVLPLGFHITYWDNSAWRDRYALAAATARQRGYAQTLAGGAAGGSVYTPQMVIDGRTDAVGSDRAAVLAAIAAAPTAATVTLSVTRQSEGLAIVVGPSAARPINKSSGLPARLLLLGYDRQHATPVAHGENAGHTLTEANVVRSITDLGVWQGEAVARTVPRPIGEAYALLLQAADGGIIAAAVAGGSPAS